MSEEHKVEPISEKEKKLREIMQLIDRYANECADDREWPNAVNVRRARAAVMHSVKELL